MKNVKTLGLLGANLLAFSVAAASPSYAAEVAKDMKIEEVLITARRSEENAQSVPVSVAALSSQDLIEASITSATDLQQNVPGIFLGGSGGAQNPVYVIRGQSKGLLGTSSPAVVSYFAEVPQPSWGSAVPQFDMQNIQVLKGPQGILFGRNTTGGAILYAPQTPSHEQEGYVGVSLGDENLRRIQGAINIPLVENSVAIRLAADINKRDGYTKNIGVGDDLDAVDTEVFRVSLLNEYDKFKNTLIIDSYSSESDGFNNTLTEIFTPSGLNALGIVDQVEQQLAAQQASGPFVNNPSFDQSESNERLTVVNRTEFEINDNLQLINIFGYQKSDLEYSPNIDGMSLVNSPVVAAGFTANTDLVPTDVRTSLVKAVLIDQTKQTSNEIQLKGLAFDDKLDWLVGAFWLKSEPDGAGQINGTTVFQSEIDFVHPLAGPMSALTSSAGAQYLFLTDESKAIFAHGEYDLTDALSLEVGVRYTEDDFEACIGTGPTGIFNGSAPSKVSESDCESGDVSKIVNSGVVKTESDEVTWSVGLNWQATDDLFAYGVARHGYRAGGANGPVFDDLMASYQTFEPEEVDDFEIGVRADWDISGMMARTNITYFYGEYTNAQGDIGGGVTTPTGGTCDPVSNPGPDGDCDASDDPTGGALVLNVGDTSVDGFELELVLMPTENLSITVNGTFQEAEIDKLDIQSNPFIEARKTGADPFLYFAETIIQANVRYAIPLDSAADELVFNVNYYDTSEAVKGNTEIPGYNLYNVRADLRQVGGTDLDLSLFVNNATDEEYAISSGASSRALGIGSYIYGPPRLWGIEARYNF